MSATTSDRGHPIAANTTVMIVVALFAALALAGMVMFWVRRLRTDRRYLGDTGILDEPAVDAMMVEQHDRIANPPVGERHGSASD